MPAATAQSRPSTHDTRRSAGFIGGSTSLDRRAFHAITISFLAISPPAMPARVETIFHSPTAQRSCDEELFKREVTGALYPTQRE